MKAHIELDLADLVVAIDEYVQARMENVEITGVTVRSWNYTLLEIRDLVLVNPIRHHVQPDRAQLPAEKKFHY